MFGGGGPRLAAVKAVTIAVAPRAVKPGGNAVVTVQIQLTSGFHVNAVNTGNPSLIPTTLKTSASPGITVSRPIYPRSISISEPSMGGRAQVYEGTPTITVPVHVGRGVKRGKFVIDAKLRYQGCNDKMCLPPATKDLTAVLVVL